MEDSGTSTALIPLLERISLDADDATSRVVDLPDGSRVWLVGDYDDARTVLTDPRFSADDQIPGYPCLLPAPPRPGALSFLRMDAPQHGRVRRVLTPSFTMRRIEKMRPGIQDATRRLIEDMREEGPPVDLVDRFALPLPSLVICQLLGVPYEDHGAFQEHSRAFLSTDGTAEEATAALTALGDYIRTLALRRRTEPADDLLSTAVQQQEAAGMTDEDVVAMARLLLIAGHETTANMLGLSVLTLFEHPDQLSALHRDPALVKPAVEELLRHHSIVRTALGRVALADVLLPGGRTVRAGGRRRRPRDQGRQPGRPVPHRPRRRRRGHPPRGTRSPRVRLRNAPVHRPDAGPPRTPGGPHRTAPRLPRPPRRLPAGGHPRAPHRRHPGTPHAPRGLVSPSPGPARPAARSHFTASSSACS